MQSQGVQEAFDTLAAWIGQAENQLKNLTKHASLNQDRLDERLREHKFLTVDIESHRPSFESINESAAELIANPDNSRVARKIDAKMKDLNSRCDKLQERVAKRSELLEGISSALDGFLVPVAQFDEWYTQVVDTLDSSEKLKADQLSAWHTWSHCGV